MQTLNEKPTKNNIFRLEIQQRTRTFKRVFGISIDEKLHILLYVNYINLHTNSLIDWNSAIDAKLLPNDAKTFADSNRTAVITYLLLVALASSLNEGKMAAIGDGQSLVSSGEEEVVRKRLTPGPTAGLDVDARYAHRQQRRSSTEDAGGTIGVEVGATYSIRRLDGSCRKSIPLSLRLISSDFSYY